MPDFAIVDTHVHLYDPARLRQSWIDGNATLEGPHLLPDLDTARENVEIERIVFVEAGLDPGQHVREAAWVAELAKADLRLHGMVAAIPLEQGAAVRSDLEQLAQHAILKGVRRLLHIEADGQFCLQPSFIEGLELLPAFGLSFDLCIYHHQLASATELVRRCPEVRFILDHIAKPGIAAGLMEPWRTEMKALAALPNVACKLSGVITEADHASWTREQIKPYIQHAAECFGFDRIMFGSDWPVSEQTHRYAEWVEILEWALEGCSADERRRLFRDNAIAHYRL